MDIAKELLWEKILKSTDTYKIKSTESDKIITTIPKEIFNLFTDYAKSKSNYADHDILSLPFEIEEIEMFFDRLKNLTDIDSVDALTNYCILSDYFSFNTVLIGKKYLIEYNDIENIFNWITDNYDDFADPRINSTLCEIVNNSINEYSIGQIALLMEKYHDNISLLNYLDANYVLLDKFYEYTTIDILKNMVANNKINISKKFIKKHLWQLYKNFYDETSIFFIDAFKEFLSIFNGHLELENTFIEMYIEYITSSCRRMYYKIYEYKKYTRNIAVDKNIERILDSLQIKKVDEKKYIYDVEISVNISDLQKSKSIYDVRYLGNKWHALFKITYNDADNSVCIDSFAGNFRFSTMDTCYDIIFLDGEIIEVYNTYDNNIFKIVPKSDFVIKINLDNMPRFT